MAGGNGLLARALAAWGVPTTIVDPKLAGADWVSRSLKKQQQHRRPPPRPVLVGQLLEEHSHLHSRECLADGRTLSSGEQPAGRGVGEVDEDDVKENGEALGGCQWVSPGHIRAMFDEEFAREHFDLLRGCSVIVGLHPDQATEAIVDIALVSGVGSSSPFRPPPSLSPLDLLLFFPNSRG